ncbi:hypothetical protein [Alloactinosynnema sp. L-07]|nr:hypothetical protein [Alloactinosynnema sp. L-07]
MASCDVRLDFGDQRNLARDRASLRLHGHPPDDVVRWLAWEFQ